MFIKTLAAIGGAAMLAMAIAAPVSAQDAGGGNLGSANSDPTTANQAQRGAGTRLQREERQPRQSRQARQQAPALPTPEEAIVAAQAVATSASVPCQVTLANYLGTTPDGAHSYEATCATGPGYILMASTPPVAVDCVLLAGQAEVDRARDPAADVGTQCVIPQNTDVLRVISAYATEAGVRCTVDQGASIGKSSEGNLIYEVGCSGADGFWIEKAADGWKTTECAIVTTQNATCRYSTAAEAAATLKTRIAGSEAAPCDVTEGRYMGANANGSFFEAKCSAGNGVIVRFNPEYAVQQVYPCETAQRIGGGCRLTIVPEAPAAPAAPQ
ncbi:hypothetical protein ACETK8_07060 [Brevundimonas staleyi]|uniref:Uncharacterized protein n=1 Tax=Brevundimonas staleyi TaxID=74326 RepID=A0ABW0FVA8_9CAUL